MTVSERVNHEFEGRYAWPQALDERGQILQGGAVYALLAKKPFPRLVGGTRIIYIGQTGLLGGAGDRTRLYNYRFNPDNGHEGKIRRKLELLVREHGWEVDLRWHVSDDETQRAQLESELLQQHEDEHLERPPFNNRG